MEDGQGELTVPYQADSMIKVIDGKEEIVLTGCGVLLFAYSAWRQDKLPRAKMALQKYCEYLALHRYGKSATAIFAELERKTTKKGLNWLKATYGKYVTNELEFVQYIMNQ